MKKTKVEIGTSEVDKVVFCFKKLNDINTVTYSTYTTYKKIYYIILG